MTTRRQFLKTSAIVSLSPLVPNIFANTARAARANPDAPVLIIVQLDGGNDGLNTVVPFGDDAYARQRDKLRLDPVALHKLDDHLGLHPQMKAAKALYDDGRLAIVQNVGYPNPSRSHFRSMNIWHTARVNGEQQGQHGWLGKALDKPALRGSMSSSADAIYVGPEDTPVALWGRRSTAISLSDASDLHLELDSSLMEPLDAHLEATLGQFARQQMLTAFAAADEFQKQQLKQRDSQAVRYPSTALGSKLNLIAQLLKSGSQARVYYAVQSGYDTHAVQATTHARLLREFSDALQALLDDLQDSALGDRVVVLAFSEFGRRVAENGSFGTDHGTAGPVFIAGSPARGGLYGSYPDLVNLDQGDLKMEIDFRQVYAALLDNWLGISSRDVLGGEFKPLPVLG